MKQRSLLAGLLLGALTIVSLSFTACTTTQQVTNGVTNTVTTIDTNRLAQAAAAIEPAASSVLRRAITRSPSHAAEIASYARAVQSVFCDMAANKNFNPVYLVDAANAATANLQAGASDDVIDAKNAAIALYKIFYNDKLTWSLPDNQWPLAVCQLFCDSIGQGLKDSGH